MKIDLPCGKDVFVDISSGSLEHNGAALPDQAFRDGGHGAGLLRVQTQQCGDPIGIGKHADGLAGERYFDGSGDSVRETVDPFYLIDDRHLFVDPVFH